MLYSLFYLILSTVQSLKNLLQHVPEVFAHLTVIYSFDIYKEISFLYLILVINRMIKNI